MVIKKLLREFRDHIRLLKFQEEWRENNSHNSTEAGRLFPQTVVSVGEKTYGVLNVHYYKQPGEMLRIGKYCCIADDVHFFLGGEHDYKTLTSYPFKNRVTKNKIAEAISKGPVIIEDDVWIGYGVIILSGTKIGKGAVIGAGSVVSGEVPPYSIFAGNKVVKTRFPQEVIEHLRKFDLGKLDWDKIDGNYELLYEHVTVENVERVLDRLSKIC